MQFIHPGAYQRACSCISSRRELQRGPSCKSPDSQYATTDICGSTPAVRCRRNEGTCTRTYAHKYLWQGLHCQVICTKWPYLGLPDIRLHDSITLGSQAFLCHDGAAGGETISMLKIHARKPSQSGRSESTAELAQPALSSRRAYIPAAVTPDRPSTHLVTQNLSIQDMRLCSEGLFIPHRGDALWMRIS